MDKALVFGVLVLLALPVPVGADGAEVEDFFDVAVTRADIEDALAGVAAGLDVKGDAYPVGAGLLHHRVGEAADVEGDRRVLQGAVVAALASEEVLDDEGAGLGFARGCFVKDEVLAVVLVHCPPAKLLGVFGSAEHLNTEVFVHQPFLYVMGFDEQCSCATRHVVPSRPWRCRWGKPIHSSPPMTV